MKKVLVLAAAALLFATPAMAIIAGTAHDLSAYSPSSESCVFCHTPHGGTTGGFAPLWNRSDNVDATTVYNQAISATMDANPSAASVNLTDAPLCLSCHDGSVGNVLVNQPNAGDIDTSTMPAMNAGAMLLDAADLSNDHPIGFSYLDVGLVDVDGELNDRATVEGVAGMEGAVSFGTTTDQMWCSSCHDVHGATDAGGNPVPTFLRIDNAGSALCTTCHIK